MAHSSCDVKMESENCLENVLNSRVCVCPTFQSSHLPEHVQMPWLTSALGSYIRASNRFITSIENSDLDDLEQCRIINDQIMGVNKNAMIVSVLGMETK